MKCTKCNIEIADGSSFCPYCGGQVSPNTFETSAETVKTSALAVTALILGILSFFSCGLLILPAIICGIIAAVKIGSSNGRLKGMGMAITGIVLPAAAIPFIALMMAILMPALAQTRLLAQRMMCMTNLKTIGTAMIYYTEANNGQYPTPDKWCDLLMENEDNMEKMFVCPSAANDGSCHYAMNINTAKLGSDAPDDMVLIFESDAGWNQAGGIELLATDRHQGGVNILFADGSVEFVSEENIPELKWDTQSRF